MPQHGVDADSVRALFIAGMCTAAIAATHGVGQRRVQQLVADLRPEPLAEPDDDELEALIILQRWRLGASYGTQMMEGALYEAYPLLHCSRRRILKMLRELYPLEFKAREDWARQRLERAHYEGHHWMYSVHLDFDGKLQEYGLYVGSMVEGVSRAQMALVCVTTKIPLVAYLAIFLPFVQNYGFPEQLITDKGQEWTLIVFVCNLMQARFRPHLQRSMHRAVEQSKCVVGARACSGRFAARFELTRARPLRPPCRSACAHARAPASAALPLGLRSQRRPCYLATPT